MAVVMKINMMKIRKKKKRERKKESWSKTKINFKPMLQKCSITLGFLMVNCLLQKLLGAWVQALDAVTCGIVWVDKC